MNYFETTDLALTAYLSLTYSIEKVDKSDTKRIKFSFRDTKKLRDEVDDFVNRNASVDPLEYFNAIKEVKNRIYNI